MPALQAGCHWFESGIAHHKKQGVTSFSRSPFVVLVAKVVANAKWLHIPILSGLCWYLWEVPRFARFGMSGLLALTLKVVSFSLQNL